MCYNTSFVINGGEHRLRAKEKVMAIDDQSLPELVKEIRRQLSLSQEDLARELGISFATVNRWENGLVKPSKLAKAQLDNFCARMTLQGKLKLTGGDK
jgi:DNA-binding transcriptional regulator YiaG